MQRCSNAASGAAASGPSGLQRLTHRRSVAVESLRVDGVLHGLEDGGVRRQVPKHSGVTCQTSDINIQQHPTLNIQTSNDEKPFINGKHVFAILMNLTSAPTKESLICHF